MTRQYHWFETVAADGKAMKEYLDFEIDINHGVGKEYPLSVVRSPAGEVNVTMHFPFDELALQNSLKDLQIALLRSGSLQRQVVLPEEKTIQEFGLALYNALFNADVRAMYAASQQRAAEQGKGLRIKLRIQPPHLSSLPWEYLYDARHGEYICLSTNTPLVRYMELPHPALPLKVNPPLRILGMIASPKDLPTLNVENEKQRLEAALENIRVRGMVELTWLEGQTWRDLQRAMRGGPWHIFHYVGHGGFSRQNDEGYVAVADEQGNASPLYAQELGRLLADHTSIRLVFLNACEGARGGSQDVFSSTASILLRRGIPSVVAMQWAITDRAAIEFARAFYEALADGWAVDASVCEARKTVSLAVENTLEWGTPVLYMRSPDGMLFDLVAPTKPAVVPAAVAPPAPATTPPPVAPVKEAVTPVAPPQTTQAESFLSPERLERVESPVGKVLDRWISRPLSAGWLAIILVVVVGCFFLAWRLLPAVFTPASDTPTPPLVTDTLAAATDTEAIALPTSIPATDTIAPTEYTISTPTSAPTETTASIILEDTATHTLAPPTATTAPPPRLGLSGDCLRPEVWFPFPTKGVGGVSGGCLVMDDLGILLKSGSLYINEDNRGAERVIGIYAPLSGDTVIELDMVIDELDTPTEDDLSNLSLGILPEVPSEPPGSGLIFYQREAPAATLYPIFIKSSERGGYDVYYRSGSDYMRYKPGVNQHFYFRLQNGRYYLSLNGDPLVQSASLKGNQPVFWVGYRLPNGGLINARISNFIVK